MQKFVKQGGKQSEVVMSMLASQKPEKEERLGSNQRKQSQSTAMNYDLQRSNQ